MGRKRSKKATKLSVKNENLDSEVSKSSEKLNTRLPKKLGFKVKEYSPFVPNGLQQFLNMQNEEVWDIIPYFGNFASRHKIAGVVLILREEK